MSEQYFHFDNEKVLFEPGMSVAAALVRAGVVHFRQTQVGDLPRGPFCMMGACFDCLLVIDGRPNRQGCMTQAEHGMHVERQPAQTKLGNG